jgi:hypothetical protein
MTVKNKEGTIISILMSRMQEVIGSWLAGLREIRHLKAEFETRPMYAKTRPVPYPFLMNGRKSVQKQIRLNGKR